MASGRKKRLRQEERLNSMAGMVPESLERAFERLPPPRTGDEADRHYSNGQQQRSVR